MRSLLLLSTLGLCFIAASAQAHAANLSQSDFTVSGASVRAVVVFAKPDAARLGRMDPDGDGVVTPAELEASQEAFRALVEQEIEVTADGARCLPTLEGGGDVEGDGFGLSVAFACPAPPRAIGVSMAVLRRLLPSHRHVIRVRSGARSEEAVLTAEDPRIDLALSDDASTSAAPAARRPPFWSAIRIGVEHIVTGWDHLLFLLALLLGTRGLRPIALAISAFTVAHSITLALAALDLFAPSARVIEPAIAASIAYVAFENVGRPGASHRWWLTFLFGLVHGFGFAGALRELALSRERLLPTLLGFNVGVEVGQLLVVGAIAPALAFALRNQGGETQPVRAASLAVGIVGVVVFVARVVLLA